MCVLVLLRNSGDRVKYALEMKTQAYCGHGMETVQHDRVGVGVGLDTGLEDLEERPGRQLGLRSRCAGIDGAQVEAEVGDSQEGVEEDHDQDDRNPHGKMPGGEGAPMMTARSRQLKKKRPVVEVGMPFWKVLNRLLQGGGVQCRLRFVVVASTVIVLDVRFLVTHCAVQHILQPSH